MSFRSRSFAKVPSVYLQLASLLVVSAILLTLANCGNTVRFSSSPSTGMVTVTISDPPSCAAPDGNLNHVFVSIRSVRAHISSSAGPDSSGWQELAPQLMDKPVQVDLLHLPASGQCLLAELGSTSSLPVGDYQQIRLLLVANNPTSGPTPADNACASLGNIFNCVVDKNGQFFVLELSSEAITGIKIPPGQIVGGPIHVAPGQSVDINIDFNVCDSLVPDGTGMLRLKPTLTAMQVSPNRTGISGQVVDSKTGLPVAGAIVALEQADGSGVDHIMMKTTADSNGRFVFCPLPQGAVFDVVVDAVSAGLAFNATVVLNVPGGTALTGTSAIRLVAETGTATGPGKIQGDVTALDGMNMGAKINVALSALQSVALSGGGTRQISVPLLDTSSTPNIAVQSATNCPMGTPTGANCARYTLVVPASNPAVQTVAGAFTAPATSDVLYSVLAQAFSVATSDGPTCSPSSQTVNQDANGMPLKVIAGQTTNAKRMDFTGCS